MNEVCNHQCSFIYAFFMANNIQIESLNRTA